VRRSAEEFADLPSEHFKMTGDKRLKESASDPASESLRELRCDIRRRLRKVLRERAGTVSGRGALEGWYERICNTDEPIHPNSLYELAQWIPPCGLYVVARTPEAKRSPNSNVDAMNSESR
jgi:hypothetical protein